MTKEFSSLRLDVSRETLERLHVYERLLLQWSPRINLVSSSTIKAVWERHFVDSAQLWSLAPSDWRHWVDLGSGAGFPGLVIAVLAYELNSPGRVTLVESDQRKATFLRTVARETGLSVTVLARRIEDVAPIGSDVLSARALAPLPKLLAFASRHCPDGTCLFPKGAGFREELSRALETWAFHCDKIESRTDPAAIILRIGTIARV